jgi:hypothetical protein
VEEEASRVRSSSSSAAAAQRELPFLSKMISSFGSSVELEEQQQAVDSCCSSPLGSP